MPKIKFDVSGDTIDCLFILKEQQGFKPNPEYIETRNKRVQLLMQPSLYKQLKARAKREKRSLNDLVHSILEENAERK